MKVENVEYDLQLMTIQEAAKVLHIAPQTLRNWIAQRKFPHIRIGRANMINRKNLVEWVRSREVKTWG